ncbi:MAG: glycosyltransferase [Limisphaerales bacterium]
MTAPAILGGLAFLSLALLLWQWVTGRRFPLHHAIDDRSFVPPISVLKPLKGVDSETGTCLHSWLEQEYPGDIEFLFCAESDDDAAIELVESLQKDSAQNIQLLRLDSPAGPNVKVSKLILLADRAKHEVFCLSDADTCVSKDFLIQLVQPLRDDKVGVANSCYLAANPRNAAMWWEAIGINADFWSQVLQAKDLGPMDFALGAVMAMRRETLKDIGGFEAVQEFLADDFQIGQRIVASGRRIELLPLVAECRDPEFGWRRAWQHQVRWARTIRGCRPVAYFFSLLNNTTLWLLLWLAAPVPPMGCLVAAGLLLRVLVAANLMRRLTGHCRHVPWLWLVWIKDLFGVLLWLLAFIGNTVIWRGTEYRVLSGGRLQSRDDSDPSKSAG